MNHCEPCLPLKTLSTSDGTIATPTNAIALGLAFLQQRWQQLINRLAHANELQVWQRIDRSGSLYWQAYDPVTGRSTTGSEADIRVWIEQLHYLKK